MREDAISTKPALTNAAASAGRSAYKDAGVDIDAGNALVDKIKPLAKGTARVGADGSLGGFGALFDLKAAGYIDPILVTTTDGVGTKLKLAIDTGIHNTVGIDLVAMCVNDLIVQGAEPVLFLDYFATGKLDVDAAAEVIAGIAEGCKQAGCVLAGGETAEMPGMYHKGDYDLAGFSVGVVERGNILPQKTIGPGDVVLGLPSSGVHSNGFSLVRKIVADAGLAWDASAPFDAGKTLGAALLEPTRIYVKSALKAAETGHVKGMAHITGGGLLENIPRVLPKGIGVRLNAKAWQAPPVFRWLAATGNINAHEMARTFNCGIGLVLIVATEHADTVTADLRASGETVSRIGMVEANDAAERVVLENTDTVWPC